MSVSVEARESESESLAVESTVTLEVTRESTEKPAGSAEPEAALVPPEKPVEVEVV